MRTLALVGFLIAASSCYGQDTQANPPQPPQARPQASSATNPTITIPAGTRIPVTLVSPITKKSARHGTAVRAVTAAPVMTGAQLAIPAGTYVEGTIESVDKRGPSGPTLQIRFTRILFANGYTVSVDANNSQAQLIVPETDANSEIDAMNGTSLTNEMGEAAPLELASESEPHFSLAAFTPYSESQFSQTAQRSPAQSTGQPPPLHAPGPSIGTAVGISLGATAAVIVALVVLTHHGSNPSAALFDTGWQFDMILQGPLTLDGASVANAIAATVAQ